MVKEMGIELMFSIWLTVDRESENYREMLEKGYLIRTERGFQVGLDFQGATILSIRLNMPEPFTRGWSRRAMKKVLR